MASGHVNRVNRPNTWLHRPMLQNVKKILANPEPSTHVQVFGCRHAKTISTLGQPASEKRQGRKSRGVGQRRCSGGYGDLAPA
jgi:hypothetical protein